MDANVYHVMHVGGALLLTGFTFRAFAAPPESRKSTMALAGIFSLATLVGGLFGSGSGPVVGASAGVFGILLAYALVFPNRTIVPLIPPIPMPARVFVLLYAVLELVLGVTGTQAGVAHFAHLGGMLGGWLVCKYWRSRPGNWRGLR